MQNNSWNYNFVFFHGHCEVESIDVKRGEKELLMYSLPSSDRITDYAYS